MAQHEAKKATAWRHLCSKFNDQLFQPQSGGTLILAPQPPLLHTLPFIIQWPNTIDLAVQD